MTRIDKIRNGLIDKILAISSKDFLEALDEIVSSSSSVDGKVALTEEQIAMLELSEKDIQSGRLISQEAMAKRNLEWLNAM